MTTDGGSDERRASYELVGEGNEVYCCAHLIQLAIDDVLNTTRATTPALCSRHRALVSKLHDLVIFILSHKDVHTRFCDLTKEKRQENGARQFETLVFDNDTRWDSEVDMIERVVYFDAEILLLFREDYDIPHDLMISGEEFDLAYAMILVLTPFRIFTKFVQNKHIATLYRVPRMIDDLISGISEQDLQAKLRNRYPTTMDIAMNLQRCLAEAVKKRFASMFEQDSLAMAALMLSPGKDRFVFSNFEFDNDMKAKVIAKIADEVIELLPSNSTDERKQHYRRTALITIELAKHQLDEVDESADPLAWWPQKKELSLLFPVAQMLFAIPASSAEDERAFSSAGFLLNQRRGRLALDSFKAEFRVRQFIVEGTSVHTQDGRQARMDRFAKLLDLYKNNRQ